MAATICVDVRVGFLDPHWVHLLLRHARVWHLEGILLGGLGCQDGTAFGRPLGFGVPSLEGFALPSLLPKQNNGLPVGPCLRRSRQLQAVRLLLDLSFGGLGGTEDQQ